jgi:TRAP-type C4-dicarboxylate transport system substrate-binding protein
MSDLVHGRFLPFGLKAICRRSLPAGAGFAIYPPAMNDPLPDSESLPAAMRLHRRAVALGGAALALPFVARQARAEASWTLFSHYLDPASAVVRGLRRMADQVRQRSRGALQVTVRTAGTLPIDAHGVMPAVAGGRVEMGEDGMHAAHVPQAAVMRLPMLLTSGEEFARAAALARPVLEEELLGRGVVLLGHYRTPMQCFWSRTRATSFADLARQRIRVSSVEQGEFLRHYQALQLMMSTVEFGEGLREGKVDGTFTTAFLGGRMFARELRHVYLAGPNFNDGVIVAGRAAMAQLPEDVAGVLREAARDAVAWIAATQDAEEVQLVRQMSGQGLAATPADAREVADAVQKLAPYWDSWVRLRGGTAETLLAAIREELDR